MPGEKWSGAVVPRNGSGSREPTTISGGKLRSSSGGSPVSTASPSSRRESNGLGAVGRGGGAFFFSSLKDRQGSKVSFHIPGWPGPGPQ